MSPSHLLSYRGVSCTSLTAWQILVQYTNGDGFVPFYSGGYSIANELTKSQKKRACSCKVYGRFENLRVVSGCKETVLLCRTRNTSKILSLLLPYKREKTIV